MVKAQGDKAKDKGDKAKDKGDKAKDKGDKAKDKGDKAKDKGDKAKVKGDKDKGDAGPAPPARLRQKYEQEIRPKLAEKFQRSNRLGTPRLQKIVVNMGVGSATGEKKHLEEAVSALTQIAGQKPAVTKARLSIAGFRLRQDMQIGCKVTLRGTRMYEFLDRLISLALPRVRDFRGVSPDAFDGHGNYSLGLSEQLVFPELNPDKYTRPQGMNVTIVMSGGSDDQSRELLRELGMPFRV